MTDVAWLAGFPGLADLDAPSVDALARSARRIALPAGARIFGPGKAPDSFILLVHGTIRVQQMSEGGREIVLYRVAAGESCPLTTACLLGYQDYVAEAVAETDVEAVAVPRQTFDTLIAASPPFRRFVFQAFSQRVTDLCRIIDEVAFQRLDIRLAARLLARSAGGAEIAMTHHEIATEIGSAREVVSRLLTELQRRGLVAVGRGHVTIVDRDGLARLAAAV